MLRRALLIFADRAELDLARRKLPGAARPLLRTGTRQMTQDLGVDVHVFGAGDAASGAYSHPQIGSGFKERFEHAIESLVELGYEEIVAIGRDCPALSAADVAQAFARLSDSRLVLGPDHRGGCYLIGFRAGDRALLHGVRWNRNTDCAELTSRASDVFLLPEKHDIDSWADLRLAASADDDIARLVAFLFRSISVGRRQLFLFVHASARFVRLHNQLPPPRLAV